MKFHVPSFLIGYIAGGSTVFVARRLRPLLLEIATFVVRFTDVMAARVAIKREDLEDVIAEAKARARGVVGRDAPQPSA